jgi:hypothetical protein
MNPRIEMNAVHMGVLQVALDAKTFTVADVQRRTGFNIESVRTVIQRLKEKGVLEPFTPDAPAPLQSRGRGAPRRTYRLSSRQETIQEQRRTLESFYGALPAAATDEPSSIHFANANRAINDALLCTNPVEKRKLAAEAELELDAARFAEGEMGAGEKVIAHLELASAKIDFLQKRYPDLHRKLDAAREVFDRYGDIAARQSLEEFALMVKLQRYPETDMAAFLEDFRSTFHNPVFYDYLIRKLKPAPRDLPSPDYVGWNVSEEEMFELTGFEAVACVAPL